MLFLDGKLLVIFLLLIFSTLQNFLECTYIFINGKIKMLFIRSLFNRFQDNVVNFTFHWPLRIIFTEGKYWLSLWIYKSWSIAQEKSISTVSLDSKWKFWWMSKIFSQVSDETFFSNNHNYWKVVQLIIRHPHILKGNVPVSSKEMNVCFLLHILMYFLIHYKLIQERNYHF